MISSIGGMTQTMMMRPPQGEPPAPEEMFSELDVDGSGTLDETELQAMIERMEAHHPHGDETREAPDAATMLSDLDTDGDGALSLEELEAGRPAGPPPPRGGEEAVAASAPGANTSKRRVTSAEEPRTETVQSTGSPRSSAVTRSKRARFFGVAVGIAASSGPTAATPSALRHCSVSLPPHPQPGRVTLAT